MQVKPTQTLPSFTTYLNKVFAFRQAVGRLSDARHDPEISPQTVFLALFHGFVFRLTSFKELEADLAQPQLHHWIGAERAFGDDTLRYSLCGFALGPLEEMLVQINRRLKRNKAFDPGRVQGRIVAALDGIEVLSSFSRCCQFCLQRRVPSKDPQGNPVEQIQYYHRAVGCQLVSAPVKPFLAIEWVRPGEGEDTAALRLLRRLPQRYGSRFFDILLLDSLYAQAPVLKLAKQIDWEVVITLKQENREVYQNAMGLFQHRTADHRWSEHEGGTQTEIAIWETEGLPFTQGYPEPVRIVRSEEKVTQQHYRRGKLQSETTEHQWLWITNLDRQAFPGPVVRRLGHDRWKNENNGWNDLTQNWALKHGFLHACQHRPKVIGDDHQPQPVPNRGLMAVTLILCLAFALSSAFCLLHSKIYRLYHPSLREIARQLYRSLWQLQPPIRAPS
jgi:hypothetical protein